MRTGARGQRSGIPWSWNDKQLWATCCGCWDLNFGLLHAACSLNPWAIVSPVSGARILIWQNTRVKKGSLVCKYVHVMAGVSERRHALYTYVMVWTACVYVEHVSTCVYVCSVLYVYICDVCYIYVVYTCTCICVQTWTLCAYMLCVYVCAVLLCVCVLYVHVCAVCVCVYLYWGYDCV